MGLHAFHCEENAEDTARASKGEIPTLGKIECTTASEMGLSLSEGTPIGYWRGGSQNVSLYNTYEQQTNKLTFSIYSRLYSEAAISLANITNHVTLTSQNNGGFPMDFWRYVEQDQQLAMGACGPEKAGVGSIPSLATMFQALTNS